MPNERDKEREALANMLTNACQILDVVKQEWGEAWSDWDQSVRDEMSAWLKTWQAGAAHAQVDVRCPKCDTHILGVAERDSTPPQHREICTNCGYIKAAHLGGSSFRWCPESGRTKSWKATPPQEPTAHVQHLAQHLSTHIGHPNDCPTCQRIRADRIQKAAEECVNEMNACLDVRVNRKEWSGRIGEIITRCMEGK